MAASKAGCSVASKVDMKAVKKADLRVAWMAGLLDASKVDSMVIPCSRLPMNIYIYIYIYIIYIVSRNSNLTPELCAPEEDRSSYGRPPCQNMHTFIHTLCQKMEDGSRSKRRSERRLRNHIF